MDTSSNNDLIKLIERYKNSILKVDPPESDPSRVLHYIRKLSKLPIRLEELEETGIGKTINALRKRSGGIAEEATLLVAKWKSIVKKQVEEEEAQEEKYENDTQSDHDHSPEPLSVNGTESPKWKEETETKKSKSSKSSAPDSSSDSRVHLITIKKSESSERKRKHSVEKDEHHTKKEKYKKIDEGRDRLSSECGHSEQSDTEMLEVSHSKKKKEVSHSEDRDSGEEKKKKRDKHEEKKHKKDHEKRHHKSTKHSSHKDEKHQRHHSKSSHHEKKREESTESYKHKDKKSKSRSRHDSDKKEKKERKSSKEFSEPESSGSKSKSRRNSDMKKVEEIADAGDIFGAALLSIPTNTASPVKKRSTSSKSSMYQDSPSSTLSPQRNSVDLDLLSNNVKLEPLDLDDYFKTQDDFYSPKRTSSPEKVNKQRMKSDEDMFASMTTTKNQRTKVFSGNKITYTKFPSLFELCVRILQDNFDALEYTGGVPYDVLKPILEKVSVQQLYNFENYNPYLIGETDELWEFHAKKEFRKAARQEYETWRDLYLRCIEEREEKLQSLTENISQSLANSTPVRKTKLAYLDSVVKPPRNVIRSQAKHGTGHTSTIKKSPKGPQPSPAAIQSVKERLAKDSMTPNAVHIATKPSLAVKKKKAPLMQKTLQLFKGLKR